MSLDVRMVARCDSCNEEVPVRLYLEEGGFLSFHSPQFMPDGVSLEGWRLPSPSVGPDEILCPKCRN